jgi:hypothetical protein
MKKAQGYLVNHLVGLRFYISEEVEAFEGQELHRGEVR